MAQQDGALEEKPTSAVAVRAPMGFAEMARYGDAFVKSGMFGRDLTRVAQALTKIQAGQELGIRPFASMRAVHVIDGTATLSAGVMAAMVKNSGRYDYRVKSKTLERCEIEFREKVDGKWEVIGVEEFSEDEARAANLLGKQNWQKYRKPMMFARCMSNGVRTYCPDVFNGMTVYTPDELGAVVDGSGEVLHVENSVDKSDSNSSQTLHVMTEKQLKMMMALFNQFGITPDDRTTRLEIASKAIGRAVASAADITKDEAGKVIDYLTKNAPQQDDSATQFIGHLFEQLGETDRTEQLKLISDALGRQVTRSAQLTADDLKTVHKYLEELVEARRQNQDDPKAGLGGEVLDVMTGEPESPAVLVTPEICWEIRSKVEQIGLSAYGRNKFLMATTPSKSLGYAGFTDVDWLKVSQRTDRVLQAEEELPQEWFVKEAA